MCVAILHCKKILFLNDVSMHNFWIRQYPYNSLTFARHNILADNFAWYFWGHNFVYTGLGGSLSLYICCLSLSGLCIPFRVMVKDLRMIILCISNNFLRSTFVYILFLGFGDFIRISLSLSIPFTSLSLSPLSHSLSLLSLYISPSTFLSPSLSLLSIILFGVSNERFRPCFFYKIILKTENVL